jgi:hypothetical protein
MGIHTGVRRNENEALQQLGNIGEVEGFAAIRTMPK